MEKQTILYIVTGIIVLVTLGLVGNHFYSGNDVETGAVISEQVMLNVESDMVPAQPGIYSENCNALNEGQVTGIQGEGFYGSNPGNCYDGAVYCPGVPDCTTCCFRGCDVPNPLDVGAGEQIDKNYPKCMGSEVPCYTCSNYPSSKGTWGDDGKFYCCPTTHPFMYDGMCHTTAPCTCVGPCPAGQTLECNPVNGQCCTGGTAMCTDTDGGKDFYTKGTCKSGLSGNSYTDKCDGELEGLPAVKEYFCDSSDQSCPSQRAARAGYICTDGKLVVDTNPCTVTSPDNCPHVGAICIGDDLCTDAYEVNGYYYCEIDNTQNCPNGCVNKACVGSTVCTAGQKKCEGSNLLTCKSDGSGWSSQVCPYGCENNACKNEQQCTPGQTECVGTTSIKECDQYGVWGNTDSCPTSKPICEQGTCKTDPCQSVTCANQCKNANTLYYAGYCNPADGTCVYNEQACQYGCENNACKNEPDPCASETCGNGVCSSACGETTTSCPSDCNPCASEVCGNSVCNSACGEDSVTCPADCGNDPCASEVCGNEYCNPNCETAASCPADCGDECTTETCGNGVCNEVCGETKANCAEDCEDEPTGIWSVVGIFAGIIALFGGAAWFIIKKM